MNEEEKAEARIELFMFAKNSFDDILNKAEDLGLLDEFTVRNFVIIGKLRLQVWIPL